MKFHGIDMQGPYWVEIVDSLPTWTLADERRIIYLSSNDTIYLGTGTGWVKLMSGTGGTGSGDEVMVRQYVHNVNLKNVGTTLIYTVPTGYMFLSNSYEITTSSISGVSSMPYITFGVQLDRDRFVEEEQLDITLGTVGRRQIWNKPFGGGLSGTQYSFTVTVPSSCSTHIGTICITGYLVPQSTTGPNIPYPAHIDIAYDDLIHW